MNVVFPCLDNLDTSGLNEELPSLALSSSNLLDTGNTNSFLSKPSVRSNRNVQPDILTHGNLADDKIFNNVHENDGESQSSIADKKSISSLYVDMIPDNITHNNLNYHDVSSSNDNLNVDDENFVSIPVFVSFLRVPINNVHSSLNTATWNKNREIRLGIIFLPISILKYLLKPILKLD